jgi:hypothetical protein
VLVPLSLYPPLAAESCNLPILIDLKLSSAPLVRFAISAMSGYPGGTADGSGLDSLFAQLRQQQNKPINLEPSYGYYNGQIYRGHVQPQPSQQLPPGFHQPSISSPLPTPPTTNQPPHHASAILSPVETPPLHPQTATGIAPKSDRTSTLLNLLKFSEPSASSTKQPAPIGTPHALSRDASVDFTISGLGTPANTQSPRGSNDLLAALMGSALSKAPQPAGPQPAAAPQPSQPSFGDASAAPPTHTQAYLLQLLNQPKPAQYDTTPQLTPAEVSTPFDKNASEVDAGLASQALKDVAPQNKGHTTDESRSKDSLLAKEGKENAGEVTPSGLFTYVNPFEQLAASSPRNRTPRNASGPSAAPTVQILKRDGADNKRKKEERIPSTSANSKRKLEPSSQVSSSPPTPLPDGRTPLEALIGIGAPGGKATVAEALNEVGNEVDKQVQEAIAKAEKDGSQAEIEKDLQEMLAAETEQEFEETAQTAAKAIKKELAKSGNKHVFDNLPAEVAEAVTDIIDDAAHGHIADSWESADADDTPSKKEDESIVKVYNFPMRPWSSITIKESDEPRPTFRPEAVMDIARLKKEFDHIDRTLVTASNNYIVYGMSKNGGFRIIRQDDGKDTRMFTETHDRIFNVVTSAAPADLKESIIGTGISGTVYWGLIKDGEVDNVEDHHLEMHGFAMPPMPSLDTESPGGVLKTRARKSAGHPNFFAIGRGKYIHIIWPTIVMKSFLKDGKDRIADTEKYLTQHPLKINTGKAGKDFLFSEDDTTIVSLDKAGRVKFWDIRTLVETDSSGNPHPVHTQPIEVKEPILTFITTHPLEKSWPTSVLFVDKARPYQRGGALRYLIVGMKQNHTLQLWDLALGKPVQEIHLPHSQDSDAVCSVIYHPTSGMIIVGHPTRNSIYFLHLSAPKYNLPKNISQAEFMIKLADKDGSIPKPDSTAVVSGMREYSLDNKGSLRSLDILSTPSSTGFSSSNTPSAFGDTPSLTDDAASLFELYAMHSKGVTCLAIKRRDLGWDSDNKVVRAVDAEEAGAIHIQSIKEIPAAAAPEIVDVTPAKPPAPTRIVPRPASKEASPKEVAKKAGHAEPSARPAAVKSEEKAEKKDLTSNGGPAPGAVTEKQPKNKRRKATASSDASASTTQSAQSSKTIVLDPLSNSRNGNARASIGAIPEAPETPGASRDFSDAAIKGIESRITGEVKKTFDASLESLLQDMKLDRRTQTAVAKSEQEAVLRVVSTTLNDNIEVSLSKIVTNTIQKSVLPAISEAARAAVKEQLGSSMQSHLGNNVPRELQRILPDAIGKALQQPQLLKLMSESLAKTVAFSVEEQFATLLDNVVTPAFTKLAVRSSQNAAAEIQRQVTGKIDALELRHNADSIKIGQLMQLVTGLTETVSSMAAAQTEFQGQFLRIQQQAAAEKREAARQAQSVATASNAVTAPVEEKTPQQLQYESMFEGVSTAMREGNYETAIIRWLQTGLHQEFFENYFSQFKPDFIQELNPLLLLSIGSAISGGIENQKLLERLAWLELILAVLQSHVNAQDLVSLNIHDTPSTH